MSSSSLIAHRMRNSAFTTTSDGLPGPSVSSFIDGLSPHPSVHTHAFLSSMPPPLIQGLERHPDAPKPIPSSLFLDHGIVTQTEAGAPLVDETPLSESSLQSDADFSLFSSRSSRFVPRSPSVTSNAPQNSADQQNSVPMSSYDVHPTFSTFSAFSSTSTDSTDSQLSDDDDAAYDGDDDREHTRCKSPFSDKRAPLHLQVVPILAVEPSPSTLPSPHSCNSGFSRPFSGFTNHLGSGLSRLVSKSPASPGAISRLLMEYLRGIE